MHNWQRKANVKKCVKIRCKKVFCLLRQLIFWMKQNSSFILFQNSCCWFFGTSHLHLHASEEKNSPPCPHSGKNISAGSGKIQVQSRVSGIKSPKRNAFVTLLLIMGKKAKKAWMTKNVFWGLHPSFLRDSCEYLKWKMQKMSTTSGVHIEQRGNGSSHNSDKATLQANVGLILGAGSHSSYWSDATLLNFGVQVGTEMHSMPWPLTMMRRWKTCFWRKKRK